MNQEVAHDESPFLIYAVGTPRYPACWFAGANGYGRPQGELDGSTVLLSAGLMKHAIATGDEPLVSLCGVWQHRNTSDPPFIRFAEQAIAALVGRKNRITVTWNKLAATLPDWPRLASAAGFRVEETADYAVCAGTGEMLSNFQWLQGVDWEGATVIASAGPLTPLESSLIQTASTREGDVHEVWSRFYHLLFRSPAEALREIDGYSLFATFGGPDSYHVVVNRLDTRTDHVTGMMADIASNLGMPLYDAGDLSRPDERGNPYGVFVGYGEWIPVPSGWRRVV